MRKLVNHHRNCGKCRQRKPLKGGGMLRGGRIWVCADCKVKRVPHAA